jgi:nickel/cobalt transporter (NicO) family protein
MHMASIALLVVAAATVAILHSILPDHWVPLAIIARTQRWGLIRVARVSALASIGHVLASVALAGVIAVIGLQFQRAIDVQQGHIVGAVLVLTGLGFLLWGLTGHGHRHDDGHHDHRTDQAKTRTPGGDPAQASGAVVVAAEQPLARRLAAIAVPFGVAASPDLTILPIALAASAIGGGTVAGVLVVFATVTVATFVGLTVLATLVGYQIKGEWLERNATSITALVLIAIGVVAFVGF